MPSEELNKLAEELKESRENAEVTLQHIATKTRIDIKFLQAIEEGNFEIMPEVYIRAFIKEYAIHCNLDPVKTLEKYDLAKKGKSIQKVETEEKEKPIKKEDSNIKKEYNDTTAQTPTDKSSKGNKQKVILYGGIIVIFAAIIAAYFLFIKNSSPDIVVEKPFEEVLQEQNKRFEVPQEEETSTVQSSVVTDSLVLNIKASDTCWVNVTIDENLDKEFMLYRNTSTVVKASSRFDFIVGNAGGITLELDGKPIEINGSKGQRRTFSVNKDGLINPSN